MLARYLDERARKYCSGKISTSVSVTATNAREVWNYLRSIFISKQDFDFENPITVYLTTLPDGHFCYSEGVYFEKLVEHKFSFLEDTCKIILQLAVDDGIAVNCYENKSFYFLEDSNLFGFTNKTVYEFTYIPSFIKEK